MEKRKKLVQGLRWQIPAWAAGRTLVLAGLFLAGLVLAGGKAVFGAYPFGLAAASSASGFLGAAAVFLGSLFGSAGVGGVLPFVTAGVFLLRAGLSMWLAADDDSFPFSGKREKQPQSNRSPRKRALLRYSRASGWVRRKATQNSAEISVTPEGIEPEKQHTGTFRKGAAADVGSIAAGRRRGMDTGQIRNILQWADRRLFTEHIFIRMAMSALASFTAGAWAIVRGGYQTSDLWGAVFSILMAPLCTYLFYAAHDRHMRTSAFRETGILAALALLCRSLSVVTLPLVGCNLGQGAALAAAFLTGSSFGVARGGLVGLACGLFLEPVHAPAFALAGAVTGAFSAQYSETVFALGQGYSRALGLAAGAVSAVVWSIYSGGYRGLADLVPEILLVTAVLLPFYAYDTCRLPAHWCGVIPDTRRSERTAVAEMALAGREKKLTALGDGMRSLGEMLGGVSEKLVRPGRREMQNLAEGCFDVYCDRCAQRSRCREQDYTRWQAMLTRFSAVLTEEGGVCGADVPAELASRCAVMGRVLDEINGTAARRIGERRNGDRLRVAAEDYTHMGKLLAESARLEEKEGEVDRELTARLERMLSCHDFSAGSVTVYGSRHKRIFVHDIDLSGTRMGGEEIAALFGKAAGIPLSIPEFTLNGAVLSMEMHSLQCARCEWGKCAKSAASLAADRQTAGLSTASAPSAAELNQETARFSTGSVSTAAHSAPSSGSPSGDTVSAFAGDGKQYMILSDGMGTGRMAALTSSVSAVFLERLLTAGATMETALKMLNSVIRAGCDECAATVDLCEIDLVTMEARFVKSGAAPSFVIRDGSLFRLQSKTVPIGILRALDAEMIRFTVQPGDVVVMLSDGIARSYEECPWLLDFLSTDEDVQHGDVQRAAEKIVEQAAARGATDDITAGVMRILN